MESVSPVLRMAAANGYMVEILWTRRETGRLTEKTNLNLRYLEKPAYSTHIYRTVTQAAYLTVGKNSEQLRDFGLEPQAESAASRIPDPPPNVTVRETSETSVLVDWDTVAGARRYYVFYGMDITKMSLFGSATAPQLEVRGLTEGTKYFFYVKVVDSVGESAPSNFTSRRTL